MEVWRPVAADDAEAVLSVWHRHQVSVLGRPDNTLDEVADFLADPDLEPTSPVVVADGGSLAGVGLLLGVGGNDVELDVVAVPGRRDLMAALLEERLAVAHRLAGGPVKARQGCYRDDAVTAALLQRSGFTRDTTFHRMRRALSAPVEVVLPDGVVVEPPGEQDDDVLRRAHRLHQETFREHYAFHPRDWEDWRTAHLARADPGRLWFATVDGEDAGFLHETDQFVEDDHAGYVMRVGVLSSARGSGVAKALLLSCFEAVRERGLDAVVLHVDTANPTGALRLYESVGMSVVLVLDSWSTTR